LLELRWEQAREAEASAKGKGAVKGAPPRLPEPLSVPGVGSRLPLDLVQDEIGLQIADSIAVTARVIISRAKDQRRSESFDSTGDVRRLRGSLEASQSGHESGLSPPGG